MGVGDWLIASAQVKTANETTGMKVRCGDGKTQYIDKEILVNNPRIARDNEPCVWVANYPNSRPYISRYELGRIVFNDSFKVSKGEVFLTDDELKQADERLGDIKDFILVEPHVKMQFAHSANKAWPHFDELLKHDRNWLQIGATGTEQKTRFIQTDNFRQAMAILSRAKLYVGTDGGLHHAAAALGIPAVVIWTGFTSPKHLGYDEHINIHDGGEPCGNVAGVCQHCLDIAKNISVERVLDAVDTIRH